MLSCSNIQEYVEYERCKINGKDGCRSANFLSEQESYISLQRLYDTYHGGKLSERIQVLKKSKLELIKQYLESSDDCRKLGVLLAMETGLRVGELCTLQKQDICGNRLKIECSEHKAQIDGKNTYFLADSSTSKWLFPNPDDDSVWMHSYFFDRTIRRVCRDIHIPVRFMHKLRKSYCSVLLAQGIPEKLVQEQLGHADISTTQKAYHYNVFDTDEKECILGILRWGKKEG